MGFIDDLKSAVLPEDPFFEVSWEDRLAEAAYTPPSGLRITFDFENVKIVTKKKGTVFEFADVDGALVQDHGVGARRFPMRLFFAGADHDLNAQVVQAALDEKGNGLLEHPMYGEHTVVPLGDITRRDDLVTRANQTIFEVTFWKTIGVVYPTGQEDATSAVLTAIDLFNDGSAAEFATQIDTDTIAEEQGLLNTINDLLGKVESVLKKIAAVNDVVSDKFQDYVDTINRGIDVLIKTPLALARQTKLMIQEPSRALASISARLDAYGNLASDIFSSPDAISDPGGLAGGGIGQTSGGLAGTGNDSQSPNKFHTRDLFASTFVASSMLSVLYTDTSQATGAAAAGIATSGGASFFVTQAQAIDAAEVILNQMDALTAWRDDNYKSISGQNLGAAEAEAFIATPATMDLAVGYAALRDAASLTAGFLVKMSFSLKQERSIILGSPRSMVDLVAELYGSVDDQLDFFINSNNLTGDEILELPRGKKIVYYV